MIYWTRHPGHHVFLGQTHVDPADIVAAERAVEQAAEEKRLRDLATIQAESFWSAKGIDPTSIILTAALGTFGTIVGTIIAEKFFR